MIFLNKEIDDECAREVIEKLLKLDIHNHRDITMYIDSPGGSVSAGLAIYDTMNMIKSNVSTICMLVWHHFYWLMVQREKDIFCRMSK